MIAEANGYICWLFSLVEQLELDLGACLSDSQKTQPTILFRPIKMIGQPFIRNIWEVNIDDFQHLVDFFYILVFHTLIQFNSILFV